MNIQSNYYLEYFIKLKTAPELLQEKMFPNTKEITESMGAFFAVKKHIPFALNDPSINCFVVGDGHVPRTGMLIARITAWNVTSIDPSMRIRDYNTKRLLVMKDRIENCIFPEMDKAIIVSVHSHAEAQKTWSAIKAKKKYFVNIPCCVKSNMEKGNNYKEYIDAFICSPRNLIEIYEG